jgi:hypothetical protein
MKKHGGSFEAFESEVGRTDHGTIDVGSEVQKKFPPPLLRLPPAADLIKAFFSTDLL